MNRRPVSSARKTGLFMLVAGLCLMLGSCGPFGYSIKRAVDANVAGEYPLEPGERLETGPLTVGPDRAAQIAIDLEVSTDSVQETAEGGGTGYEGRFHFPLTYTVRAQDGRTLFTENTAVSWDTGTRRITLDDVGPRGGIVALESSFDKFDPPADGTVSVEAVLEPDPRYGAQAQRVRLLIYENVSRHGGWILAGVAMLIAGALLTVIGIVLLVAAHSSGPAPVPAGGGSSPRTSVSDDDPSARNWAMLCHLSALLGYLGIPLGHIIGPLVVWLVKRSDSPFIDDQGRESLNFQISILIYVLVSLVLTLVFIGFVLLFALVIFHLVMTIVAAIRASGGQRYRYPLTIRLLQ